MATQVTKERVGNRTAIVEKAPKGKKEDEGPDVRIEKAHGSFVLVVQWLLARSDQEKLAAVAFRTLMDGDIQEAIEKSGTYDGQIGDDLYNDWEAVSAFLGNEEGRRSVSAEDVAITSYLAGVKAGSR
jgi:hypothetical protein